MQVRILNVRLQPNLASSYWFHFTFEICKVVVKLILDIQLTRCWWSTTTHCFPSSYVICWRDFSTVQSRWPRLVLSKNLFLTICHPNRVKVKIRELTCIRICSSLTGLGMNPTSQPSLTNLPIHQLLSYFSLMWRNSLISKDTALPWTGESSSTVASYATFVRTAKATGLP